MIGDHQGTRQTKSSRWRGWPEPRHEPAGLGWPIRRPKYFLGLGLRIPEWVQSEKTRSQITEGIVSQAEAFTSVQAGMRNR